MCDIRSSSCIGTAPAAKCLSGRFRMIMRVENGLLVRTDEYHDRAKVEAFMRLFGP